MRRCPAGSNVLKPTRVAASVAATYGGVSDHMLCSSRAFACVHYRANVPTAIGSVGRLVK
jgi:hypothetical protein